MAASPKAPPRKKGAPSLFDGNFVIHTLEMRASPAWRGLPDDARRLIDRLEVEHMRRHGLQNGNLVCLYNHFVEAGINEVVRSIVMAEMIALQKSDFYLKKLPSED